jgi:transcriptional regulator with XRE-family HTH domain
MEKMVAVLKSNVLREYIVRKMPSQAEFAQKVPVSDSYLSQLLSGQRNASWDVRRCLLKVTGMEFDELFELRPPKRRVPSNKTLLRIARTRAAAKKRRGKRPAER